MMKMRYINMIFASAAILLAAGCSKENLPGSSTGFSVEQTSPAWVSGEVLVQFDESLSDLLDGSGLSKSVATRANITSVDELLDALEGYQLERVFPVVKATEERTRVAGLHLWYVVRFGENESVENVVKKLSALGKVQTATPVRTIKKNYSGKVIPFSAPVTKLGENGEDLLKWQWNLKNEGAAGYTLNSEVSADLVDGYPFDKTAAEKFVAGNDIGWEAARRICKGDPSIIVAVLDEGLDMTHPELAGSLWVNEDEVEFSKEDNDGNGYTGDYHGYDFINNTGDVTANSYGDTGHGSHCGGVIAAMNGDGGISSIAGPQANDVANTGVRLMSCQIFSGNLSSSTISMVRAIKYATDNGAVILQCSLGYTSGASNPYEYGGGYTTEEEWEAADPLVKAALDYFHHNAGSDDGPIKGGIAIFASGNEYAPMAGFPGAYEKCISVASVAGDFTPAAYTNYGTYTNISAPGGDQDYYYDFKEVDGARGAAGCILSSVPAHIAASGFGYMEGTSMACPHVSGVVALGLSYAAQLHRHFTADEFMALLTSEEACTPIDDIMRGNKFYYKYQPDASNLIHARTMSLSSYRGQMGSGVVNAYKLLNLIQNAGVPMEFPNLYIQEGSTVTVNPSTYFNSGSFRITIDDDSVAKVSAGNASASSATGSVSNVSGNIRFYGLKSGSTTATINYAGGSQTFAITVRSSSSWL